MNSKQILDVQQMQHLQELGLKLKETMMYWTNNHKEKQDWYMTRNPVGRLFADECLPAYTLQDVLDALPKDISKDGCTWYASLYIDFENNRIAYGNTDRDGFEIYHEIMIEKDLIDAAYSMLCWAIENKFVETNKNE